MHVSPLSGAARIRVAGGPVAAVGGGAGRVTGWRGPLRPPARIKPPLAEFGPVGRLKHKPNTLLYYMCTRGTFVFDTKAFLMGEHKSVRCFTRLFRY